MRPMTAFCLAGTFALGCPAASAQTTPVPAAPPAAAAAIKAGWVDFGVRATDVDGDEDRFERYRDLGGGAFLERMRWSFDAPTRLIAAEADNAGRTDQRYRGAFEQTGQFRTSFEWNQVPLRLSTDTRTPYMDEGPGVLRLNDSIQAGIQAGTLRLADIVPLAEVFETGYRRDIAAADVWFSARPDLDVRGSISTSRKHGSMPWGASFGFNLAVEVPVPIDTRTTDARFEIEWARGGSLARLNYDGSWFQNDIERLVWDNPIRISDTTSPSAYVAGNGTSTGRMSLWPSNQMHTVGATGSMALPRRSRLTGTVAFGASFQDEEILPHTINTAIAPIELPRERAGAEARILIGNLLFTSRPWRQVGFTAKYRLHDRDNNTPHFDVDQRVRLDQVREPFDPNNLGKEGPEFYSTRRQNVDLEASYTPLRHTQVRVGYANILTDRTFRIYEETSEHTVRAAVDTTGHPLVSFRGQVERSTRRGDDFNPLALAEAAEQPGMRHFDIANRNRTRVTGMVNVTPIAFAGVNAAVTVGNDDFPDSPFGLRDNDHQIYTLGGDLTTALAELSVSYANERYDTFQLSRQASPGPEFTDPRRDWGLDAGERVHSVLSSIELPALIPRTWARLSYDYSRSKTQYDYQLGSPGVDRTLPEGSAVTTLPPVTQLPPVFNEIHSARLDTRYFLTRQVAVGFVYWYERYRVRDYALGDETIRRIDLPNGLLMYYRYRPYRANSFWARLTYLF